LVAHDEQGIVNSVVYCIDEDILYHCTPGGTKAAFVNLISKEKRQEQQAQKYALGSVAVESGRQSSGSEEDLRGSTDEMDTVALD
jgi:hypothetical protein